MQSIKNRVFRLAKRPIGRVTAADFTFREEPLPELGPGQVLLRNLYLSLDPTNRIWMSDMEQYMPPVELGEVMRGVGVGRVERSNDPNFSKGSLVTGMLGWQDYAVWKAGEAGALPLTPIPLGLPPTSVLSALGHIGMTAYFGLLEIGAPKAGETVVVSAAAGATGSLVGQLAKIVGCRVVGIAGSAEKCRWLVGDLGFDAAVNYRDIDWKEKLFQACPKGIDVDFENVGGEMLDTVLSKMNLFGRVVLCGHIASYNDERPPVGPSNFGLVLMRRLRIQGFIVTDFVPRFHEAGSKMAEWLMSGKLKTRETIVEGLENAPEALNKLFDGANIGKLILKIAD